MIARFSRVLAVASVCLTIGLQAEEAQLRSARRDPVVIQAPQHDAWLTKDQAQHILTSVEMLVQQVRELSKQNRAPRPDAPGVCDPSYPGCGLIDLSGILASLCSIQNELDCVCGRLGSLQDAVGSLQDVVGACTDTSVLLGSQVDKACIDGLCLSVVALLKTVLLELRGAFTGPFPCNVTP